MDRAHPLAADRVLSPSATEPEVSAHSGNAPLRVARMNVVDAALNAASDVSRIDRKTLLVDCRVAYVCRARHAAFLVAHEHGASFHRIGKRLSRNHSTVKHGIARARHFIANDTDYAAFVERVREAAA